MQGDELLEHPEIIMNKGARYFTKFVLFPVRLIFTLNNPDVIGTNQDAVKFFQQTWSKDLPISATKMINAAYKLRNNDPYLAVDLIAWQPTSVVLYLK